MSFMTGVALSYLRESEQTALLRIMQSEDYGSYQPKLCEAEKLKQLSTERELDEADIRAALFGVPGGGDGFSLPCAGYPEYSGYSGRP